MTAVDPRHHFARRLPRREAPDAAVFLADVERAVACIDGAAFGLARHRHLAKPGNARVFTERHGPFADIAFLGGGEDDQSPVAAAIAANPVCLAGPRRKRRQGRKLGREGVEAEQRYLAVGKVAAVACEDDHALIAHVDQIDVVEGGPGGKIAYLAVEAVDVKPALLVGRDDQAGGGIGRIAPDRRIVGGVRIGGADRLGLRHRVDWNRRIARLRNGRAGRDQASGGQCEQERMARHQNVNLTPPFIVQLYSSYW